MSKERKTYAMAVVSHGAGYNIFAVRDCESEQAYLFLSREEVSKAAAVHLGTVIAAWGAPDVVKTTPARCFTVPLFESALRVRGIEKKVATGDDEDIRKTGMLLEEEMRRQPPLQTVKDEWQKRQARFTRNLCFMRDGRVLFRMSFTDMAKAVAMKAAWEQGATQAEMVELERA